MMCCICLEAECLSGQVKGTDLPASVSKQAVDADGAEFHLVEGSGLFALGVDFRAGGIEVEWLQRCGLESLRQVGQGRP